MAVAERVMVEAINRALQQALATDERVVVMGTGRMKFQKISAPSAPS